VSEDRVPQAAGWWHDYDFGTGVSLSLDVTLLHDERTEYQHVQVFEHAYLGRVLALDGIIQTSLADEFVYHDLMTHVPLCGVARPARRVLIVGGGDGGVLREVLRHDEVERVVMVEIDRVVVDLCAKYLGINGNYDDPRAELVIADAAAWVRSGAARDLPFDVVIVDSTDPIGPGEILFDDAFHADLVACMADDGVMVRQAGMPFMQRDEMPQVARVTRAAFGCAEVYAAAVPLYCTAEMAFVVGLKAGGTLREPQRQFVGRYYNDDLHRGVFGLPTWWREALENG